MDDAIGATEGTALEPGERLLWQGQPGAGRLFASVAPCLARDVVFLSLVSSGLFVSWNTQARAEEWLVLGAVELGLLYLLVRNLREAFSARVNRYLITSRRLIIATPRSFPKSFTILYHFPKSEEERHRACWLVEIPRRGKIRKGRATIFIRCESYGPRSRNYPQKVYRARTMSLYSVADPDRAIATINQIRRESCSPGSFNPGC